MKSAQFVKGMINGVEETYESPDILQVIPNDKLSEIWDLDQIGSYRRVFLNERVIAQTIIRRADPDEHGRDGIVNHTVIYRFEPFTSLDGAQYTFDIEKFAQDARAGKYKFKMPPFPELKNPLSNPPAMEL
jgi:hypothetical protein